MTEYSIKYKSTRNCVYSTKYHIIFCPKYRRSVLIDGVDTRLKELILEISKELESEVIQLEIMPDHVHILVEIPPPVGVCSYLSKIKGISASVLRKEFPWLKSKLPCLWTSSYFCSTIGGAPLEVLKQYVENQKSV